MKQRNRIARIAALAVVCLSVAGSALAAPLYIFGGYQNPGQTSYHYGVHLVAGQKYKISVEGSNDDSQFIMAVQRAVPGWPTMKQKAGDEDFDMKFQPFATGWYRLRLQNVSAEPTGYTMRVKLDS